MRPIDFRVDHTYSHALRCVEYRVPRDQRLLVSGLELSLALRYGLTGAAATHQLLASGDESDRSAILSAAEGWGELVIDHLHERVADRLPISPESLDTARIACAAEEVIQDYLAIYRRFTTPDGALAGVARIFQQRHSVAICRGWRWFRRRKAKELFRQVAAESVCFASLFYERRKADVDEVPEIALLGE